jgi:hypothetical protein
MIKSPIMHKNSKRTKAGQLLSDKRLFPDRCEICNSSHIHIKEHLQTQRHKDNVIKSKNLNIQINSGCIQK